MIEYNGSCDLCADARVVSVHWPSGYPHVFPCPRCRPDKPCDCGLTNCPGPEAVKKWRWEKDYRKNLPLMSLFVTDGQARLSRLIDTGETVLVVGPHSQQFKSTIVEVDIHGVWVVFEIDKCERFIPWSGFTCLVRKAPEGADVTADPPHET